MGVKLRVLMKLLRLSGSAAPKTAGRPVPPRNTGRTGMPRTGTPRTGTNPGTHQRQYERPKPAPEVGATRARPLAKGRMTGFEPAKLRSYQAPVSLRAHGLAGLGLFDSDFDRASIYNGQRGEVGFYKALCLEDLIDDCSSYWSVAMPGDDGTARPDSKYQTDVDCIVVQGKTMYLIDLKYYASGDVTWHTRDGQWLLCRDNTTREQVGKPRHMSRNMAMAQDRFRRIFPGLQIQSYVVLIPTQDGLGDIAPGTAWPGNVELIDLPAMLAVIRAGGAGYADDATQQKLLALLKD